MIRAIVFDFDGVLVESNLIKEAAFEEIFSEFPDQKLLMTQYHKSHQHRPRMEKFKYAAGLFPGKEEEIFKYLIKRFSQIVVRKVVECPEVKGAESLLKKITHVVPLYVSSVTPYDELKSIITQRNWAQYFKKIYGLPPTSKIDALSEVIEVQGIKKEELLFIGDSISDYEVAIQLGVSFVSRISENKFLSEGVKSFYDLDALGEWLKENL